MRLVKWFFEIYMSIPIECIRLICKLTKKIEFSLIRKDLIRNFCRILEDKSEVFYSYRERPKYPSGKELFINTIDDKEIALVIQGPILLENDFTLESIRYYRQLEKNLTIILSTWEGENEDVLSKIRELDVEIVCSKRPVVSGMLNINYQVASTLAGIKHAKRLGKKYVCKTRTDQRLYRRNVFGFMKGLIEKFPSQIDGQNGRIVCMGAEYASMIYPYFISDFVYFGLIEELEKMFSIDIDIRENKKIKVSEYTLKELAEKGLSPETMIMLSYAKKIGLKGDVTIKSYWDMIKRGLICVDFEDLGLYWPKYNVRYSENERFGYYFSESIKAGEWKKYNFGFVEWLNLYTGNLLYDEKFELFADKKIL